MCPVKSGVSLLWKKDRPGIGGDGWPGVPALYMAYKALCMWLGPSLLFDLISLTLLSTIPPHGPFWMLFEFTTHVPALETLDLLHPLPGRLAPRCAHGQPPLAQPQLKCQFLTGASPATLSKVASPHQPASITNSILFLQGTCHSLKVSFTCCFCASQLKNASSSRARASTVLFRITSPRGHKVAAQQIFVKQMNTFTNSFPHQDI